MREHYLLESCPIFRIQHIKAFMGLSGPFSRSVDFISRNHPERGFILVCESAAINTKRPRSRNQGIRNVWRQSIKQTPSKRRREPLGATPRAAASRALSRNQNTCSAVENSKN